MVRAVGCKGMGDDAGDRGGVCPNLEQSLGDAGVDDSGDCDRSTGRADGPTRAYVLADDIRLVVGAEGDRAAVLSHRHVTDRHLVALAVRYGGHLVTFDRALADSAPAGVVQLLRS